MPARPASLQPEYCRLGLEAERIRTNLQMQGDQIARRFQRKLDAALIDPHRFAGKPQRQFAPFGPIDDSTLEAGADQPVRAGAV